MREPVKFYFLSKVFIR